MKMFKKLVPAIALLVLSAAMVVTSSFAWFSMNTNVTATGMSVNAVANQVYLQIKDSTQATWNDKSQTEATASTRTAENLSPVNVFASNDLESPTAYAGGDTFYWLTANSADPASSTRNGNYKEASDSYTLVNTFNFRLNPNAGATESGGFLQVTDVEFVSTSADADISNDDAPGSLADCVSVLIVNEDTNQSQLFKQTSAGDFELVTGSNKNLSGNAVLTNNGDNAATVKVYVFFDGDHASCVTNNVVLENAYSVKVFFDCNGDEEDA